MKNSILVQKSKDFAVQIVNLCDKIKSHSALTNQLIRSGTSIGANIHESIYAQGKNDFISKLQIALKECYETEYRLELFVKSDLLEGSSAKEICNECGTISKILISSINTVNIFKFFRNHA